MHTGCPPSVGVVRMPDRLPNSEGRLSGVSTISASPHRRVADSDRGIGSPVTVASRTWAAVASAPASFRSSQAVTSATTASGIWLCWGCEVISP